MALTIRNEEARRLAEEFAALTGETLSAAVTEAVRERLEKVKRDQKGPRIKGPLTSTTMGDFLYDENGLPRTGPPVYDEEGRAW